MVKKGGKKSHLWAPEKKYRKVVLISMFGVGNWLFNIFLGITIRKTPIWEMPSMSYGLKISSEQDLIKSFLDKKKHIPDWLGDGESWDVGTGGQNSWHRLVRSAAVQVCGVKPSPERGNQLAQTVVEKTILYVMCTYNTIYIYNYIYIY